jgi:hypothetical protein
MGEGEGGGGHDSLPPTLILPHKGGGGSLVPSSMQSKILIPKSLNSFPVWAISILTFVLVSLALSRDFMLQIQKMKPQ